MRSEKRHFALVEVCQPTLDSLAIVSIRTSIMITNSNSPFLGSRIPNHYIDDLLQITAISGLSRVRTELLQLRVIPFLAPHPVQVDGKFSSHRYFRNLPSPSHGQL